MRRDPIVPFFFLAALATACMLPPEPQVEPVVCWVSDEPAPPRRDVPDGVERVVYSCGVAP